MKILSVYMWGRSFNEGPQKPETALLGKTSSDNSDKILVQQLGRIARLEVPNCPVPSPSPRVDHEDENVAMNSQENIKDTIDLVQRTNWVRAITVFGAVITSFWLTGLIFNTQGFVAALACFIGLSLIYGIGFSPMFAVSASILCFSFNAVGIWLPTISYFFAVIMLYVDIRARKLLRTACEGPFAFRYMGIKMETEFERRACGKS